MAGGKITDARMDELRDRKASRDELVEQIKKETDEMETMLELMDTGTRESISSSAASAKENRGKDAAGLDLEDEIEAKRISIKRLQELYASAVKELEELEEMMTKEQAEEED